MAGIGHPLLRSPLLRLLLRLHLLLHGSYDPCPYSGSAAPEAACSTGLKRLDPEVGRVPGHRPNE
jgi:hypothetical protein